MRMLSHSEGYGSNGSSSFFDFRYIRLGIACPRVEILMSRWWLEGERCFWVPWVGLICRLWRSLNRIAHYLAYYLFLVNANRRTLVKTSPSCTSVQCRKLPYSSASRFFLFSSSSRTVRRNMLNEYEQQALQCVWDILKWNLSQLFVR